MSRISRHPYHLVDESPWPLVRSLGALALTSGILKWFRSGVIGLIFYGLVIILLVIYQWWEDISLEGAYQGLHSIRVEVGLRWGILLFIISEVIFFFSFFWAFFHRSLSSNVELGGVWPPVGIISLDAFQVPLLNTVVLLSSGVRVTWAHHRLICGELTHTRKGLILTVVLGVYFTILQGIEYYETSFRLADRVFGATFFLATGFHGLHVFVGTRFLLVCWFRLKLYQFSCDHHFGFEAAAWYWHFVDVVWLFLFIVVYWWGGA